MTKTPEFLIVMITVPSRKVARSLTQAVLQSRLVACANILPGIESHYWWQGQLASGKELLLLLKTRHGQLKQLESLVRDLHPYDTPEFIALPILNGSRAYLKWLGEELGGFVRQIK